MTKKLTKWFPADVKPVHVGLYQTQEPDGTLFFNLFDGKNWFYGNHDCVIGSCKMILDKELLVKWRGLARMPSKG